MPFTFSHPALAVPFSKKGLCLSALIIGSMAPDFDNFAPDLPKVLDGHSLPGLFFFCLPVGFLVLFLFHKVLKKAALLLLPDEHRDRLAGLAGDFEFLPFKRLGWILGSLLLGSITHLFWDYFTHGDYWSVQWFPVLDRTLFWFMGMRIPLYFLFQNLSTVGGAALLMLWYLQWFRQASLQVVKQSPFLTPHLRFGIILEMILIALTGGLAVTINYAPLHLNLFTLYLIARAWFVSTMAFFLAEWLLFGGGYLVWKRKQAEHPSLINQ